MRNMNIHGRHLAKDVEHRTFFNHQQAVIGGNLARFSNELKRSALNGHFFPLLHQPKLVAMIRAVEPILEQTKFGLRKTNRTNFGLSTFLGGLMELRDYIEDAQDKFGTIAEVAKLIGIRPQHLSNAKSGQRGLPLQACWKLADLLDVEHDAVTAASALVTEKDEEVRSYLIPFAQAARFAQHLTIAALATATVFSLVIENSIFVTRSFLL